MRCITFINPLQQHCIMREDIISDISALGGLPVFLLFIAGAFASGSPELALKLAVALAACFAVTILVRTVHHRSRPGTVSPPVTWWQRIDQSAMPSLHAMRAASLATILMLLQPSLTSLAIGIAAIISVCAARVMLHRHDILDVLVGAFVGVAVGLGSWWAGDLMVRNLALFV